MIQSNGYFKWNRSDPIEHLSLHFSTAEFNCDCGVCEPQMIACDLIYKLELIRNIIGPIKITDGYRCAAYQARLAATPGVETAKHSQHLLGRAADIKLWLKTVTDVQFEALYYHCGQHFMAIGKGRRFLHLDLRDDEVRRWQYSY